MKTRYVSILSILLISAAPGQDEYEWTQLFNGENLEGWNLHMTGEEYNVDPMNTLKVSDGILHVDYSEYQNFDSRYMHFCRDDVFSHFIVGVEYRFVGDQIPGGNPYEFRNSGILFHSQAMSEMEISDKFPRAIEAQNLQRGGEGSGQGELPQAPGEDPIATLNLCPIKTSVRESHNCNRADSYVVIDHKDAWIRTEITVLGDSIGIFTLNGDTLSVWHDFKVQETGEPLAEGTICFQAESHPIDFRKIEIVNLVGCMDSTALNYKDYFVVHDENSCEYEVHTEAGEMPHSLFNISSKDVSISNSGPVRVDIYDLNGRPVHSANGQDILSVSFSGLRPGLYIVRAVAGEHRIRRKILRY